MSEKKSNNPPAFPRETTISTQEGMTLRDYFAAKAMQAMISSYAMSDTYFKEIPLQSYRMADAMLKERERNNDEESPTT